MEKIQPFPGLSCGGQGEEGLSTVDQGKLVESRQEMSAGGSLASQEGDGGYKKGQKAKKAITSADTWGLEILGSGGTFARGEGRGEMADGSRIKRAQ